MNLLNIPLSNGILRPYRNVSTIDVEMRLGQYALPEQNENIKITTREVEG